MFVDQMATATNGKTTSNSNLTSCASSHDCGMNMTTITSTKNPVIWQF
jgi:hypothetical protein